MHLATFSVNGRTSYGAVTGNGIVDLGRKLAKYPSLLDVIRVGALDEARAAASGTADHALKDVTLLPPVPGAEKIICVGINYADRNAEYADNRQQGKYPNLFVRFPGSFVGSGGALVRPNASEKLDYEGEIVLVIGREGRHIPRERALDHVAGLTLANEGTIRDWVRHGTLNVTQGKNWESSGSMGPWVTTTDAANPAKPLHLMTRVNGETRQDDTTERLIWDFPELIRYISTFTRLKPGDLILTGTPTGAGTHANPPVWLKPGDTLEIEVPEIGVLRNTVVDEA
jgi:2-keto-4-pentenoate hydratase/2-oxohepta-3-ene-1,7-dioic acid hydratase in catechol pathway